MSTRNRRRAGMAAAAIVPVLAAGLTVTATSAGAAPQARRVLPGTTPAWADAHARTGNASGSEQVAGRVWLQYNNASQLSALVAAVSDPHSASYRHYLTPAQFNARFQPTDAQAGAVTSWLASVGLTVTSAPSTHRWVDFAGTSAKVGAAFGVQYGTYRYHGSKYAAPSGNASVPGSLASTVLTVTGLDTMPHTVAPARSGPFPPPAGFRNATPCSSFYGEKVATNQPQFDGASLPYAVCGYTPPQLRGVYNAGDTGADGTGVVVAITDAYASPTIAFDAGTYAHDNDPGHPYAQGQLTEHNASNFTRQQACGGNGWYGEETLDVEAVHAIAPGATIRYYGAASCFDDDLDTAVVNAMNDGADVITNSWGEPESAVPAATATAEKNLYDQATATGISLLFSSGDDGDEFANTGKLSSDLPASLPNVTAVGGTSLGIGANNGVALETGWGTEKYSKSGSTWVLSNPFQYGAGGGVSAIFDKPAYQNGVVGGTNRRAVPDIGLDADPTTGMLVGETQRFGTNAKSDSYDTYRIGGTSLASPLFAGVMALADQLARNGGGSNVGFANPGIYAQHGNASAIRDVLGNPADAGNVRADFVNGIDASAGIVYSVRTFDQDSSLVTGPGYDEVTGVGAPASGFAAALAGP